MTGSLQLWSGGWWRFSRYELRGGVIRPAENANLEWYDPWELYRIRAQDTEVQPPYQSLIALLSSIGAYHQTVSFGQGVASSGWRLDKRDGTLSTSEQTRILDWCANFGLLGILPHAAISIELPLRFTLHDGKGSIVRGRHSRENGHWHRSNYGAPGSGEPHPWIPEDLMALEQMSFEQMSLEQTHRFLGPFVEENDEHYEVPVAFFREGSPTGFRDILPVSILPRIFFPGFEDAGNQFECPLPLSPEFWRMYAERVDDFLHMALKFLAAVEPVLARRNDAYLSDLQWFVEPIGVSLSFDSAHSVREQWICPSLMSSFARMALQDISAGVRMLRCECCDGPYVTSAYQARYCSQQCAWRQRKRRARAPKIDQSK